MSNLLGSFPEFELRVRLWIAVLDGKALEIGLQGVDLLSHLLHVQRLHLLQNKLGHNLLILEKKKSRSVGGVNIGFCLVGNPASPSASLAAFPASRPAPSWWRPPARRCFPTEKRVYWRTIAAWKQYSKSNYLHGVVEELVLELFYPEHLLEEVEQLLLVKHLVSEHGGRRSLSGSPGFLVLHDGVVLGHPRRHHRLLAQPVDLGKGTNPLFYLVSEVNETGFLKVKTPNVFRALPEHFSAVVLT